MGTAIVHDYLTQRGGAERVVLSLLKALPDAPLYTSLYDRSRTFPEFSDHEIRTSFLNRVPLFRRWHRTALPLLAPAFSQLRVDADVAICSSSGWAHGAHVSGRKVVYCHTPARWLYQTERYLGGGVGVKRAALEALRRPLQRWDGRAAATASRYVANSTVVRERIRHIYGIDAEVLPPPPALSPVGASDEVAGVEPGFFLCISRLLPYKNVDAVIGAFRDLREERLVVVGSGPQRPRLVASAPQNVTFVERPSDAQLRWLYAQSKAVVAASYEDFGLTPLEAAAFGRPAAVLRWGGFLDTVREGETGVFFDEPTSASIASALAAVSRRAWEARALEAHAERFSERRFVDRVRAIVDEERR